MVEILGSSVIIFSIRKKVTLPIVISPSVVKSEPLGRITDMGLISFGFLSQQSISTLEPISYRNKLVITDRFVKKSAFFFILIS